MTGRESSSLAFFRSQLPLRAEEVSVSSQGQASLSWPQVCAGTARQGVVVPL